MGDVQSNSACNLYCKCWYGVVVALARIDETQGPHSHILMTGGSDRGSYFIPKKIPTSEFVYQKKIPQCFCISKFYYLSSGKLKHANFNFGFGQKQNYTKTNTKSSHDCYSVSSSYLLSVITFQIDYKLRNIP